MWLRKDKFRALQKSCATARFQLMLQSQKREQAEKELAIARNNEDWLRVQCNVANARADALFTQFTQARLPTPHIDRPTAADRNEEEAIEMTKGGALPALEDPGDEIAQRLGIDHSSEGTLVYRS